MFIIRSVSLNDLDDLYRLSQLMTFINLPPDKDLIKEKIESALKSFKKPSPKLWKNYYIFVLEKTGVGVIGASMIHAQHGTSEEPHFYLKVGQESKFSKTLNTGFIHGTLKLGLETNGPTEIGGLILHPDYRGHEEKLGKQLSYARFLYMALYPDRFKPLIHSELMPPLDEDNNSPLWEAIGRRFMNMDYHEADKLSRRNKEFILNLYPVGTIYQTLLPFEARDSIGKVGKETEPVKKMLESIGFKYVNEVDPFDGGPHYRAEINEILPVKNKILGKVLFSPCDKISSSREYLIQVQNSEFDFLCVKTIAKQSGDKILIDEKLRSKFNSLENQTALAIPLF